MTPDERIDRFMAGCLDCGASLANRNRNTRRCTPCSTARHIVARQAQPAGDGSAGREVSCCKSAENLSEYHRENSGG